ncbi:hypothetical protein NQ315_014348 [Exocentrus adspersus]|uniref:Cytochrome P450 n=1 Tax=Exocentrus adspersus TaxID=1586481 RepID=A0AAV8VLE7_9CUCU|nr:hypothetical protein NQ315_014348 [Exocentrus adspersus]
MWLTAVFVVALTLLVIIYRKLQKNGRYSKCISEIPGPKGMPLIGNFFDTFVTQEQLFNKRRQWANEFYPIYKTKTLNLVFVGIMTPDDVEKVINSKAHSIKGRIYHSFTGWLGDGLLLSHGEKWKSRRRLLTPAFHFTILQEFLNIFNTQAEHLVNEIEKSCKKPYIDVVKPVTEFTLCSIVDTSMGIKMHEQESSESYKRALIDLNTIFIRRFARPWLLLKPIYKYSQTYKMEQSLVNILHTFSNNVIEERKKTFDVSHNTHSTKKKAMLDLLLAAQRSGVNIDDAGIREEVDTFLFGGHDTTAMCICYTLMALANEKYIQQEIVKEIQEVLGDSGNPPIFSELQQMSYMERCIKESLRLYPSIPVINRIAGEDIKTVSGHTIPKSTNILIFIYDLHRSPDFWPNPLKFDPNRFLPENIAKRHPYAFLPFSAGSRNCIGQKYGFLEVKAALCSILRKFRLEPVDTPESVKYKSDIVLRPLGEIRVKFVPRTKSI